MNMNIGQTLALLRREKKLTQPQVAQYLTEHGREISNKTISKWERGDGLPDAEQFLLLCRLYRIADALSVFAGDDRRALNDLGRQRLLEYMRLLQSSEKYLEAPVKRATRTIALYDLPVSAGTGLFLDSDHYELIDVDDSVPGEATFAVRISGNSMTPRFFDRQTVYVQQTPVLEKGECGIFILNGDAYCKLLGGDTDTQLISINTDYAPIRVREGDELRVVGRVLG